VRLRAVAAAVVAAAVTGPAAWASWSLPGTGQSAARAYAMPAGETPSATATGSSVTVTWPASTFSSGPAVPGYVVRRFDTVGTPRATLANCAGVVTGVSCTENGVPLGTWRYAVTPAAGQWRGAESSQSAAVIVTLG
jgi:hypothetical protein